MQLKGGDGGGGPPGARTFDPTAPENLAALKEAQYKLASKSL